jgi:hypothetical protein
MQEQTRILLFIIFIMIFCVFSKFLCDIEEPRDGSDLIFDRHIIEASKYIKD